MRLAHWAPSPTPIHFCGWDNMCQSFDKGRKTLYLHFLKDKNGNSVTIDFGRK